MRWQIVVTVLARLLWIGLVAVRYLGRPARRPDGYKEVLRLATDIIRLVRPASPPDPPATQGQVLPPPHRLTLSSADEGAHAPRHVWAPPVSPVRCGAVRLGAGHERQGRG